MSTVNTTTPIEPASLETPSLRAQAIRASAWTMGGFVASRGLRLASNLIMTRILLPDAFGLMAIVGVVTTGLQMFSDVGIAPSIIQSRRGDDPRYLNTAWTIQAFRGTILWLVAAAVAWPLAVFYEMPELAYLMPVAGLGALITGFNSTSIHTLNRHLDLSRESLLQVGAKAVTIVVMVIVGLITRSVWALVVGGLVSDLVTMAFSHMLIPGHRNRFVWDRECARDLISFGKWIFLSTALTFIAMSGDRLILGKLITAGVLGVYATAYVWYEAPRAMVQRLSAKVIFPAIGKARELPREELREKIARNRARVLPFLAVGLACTVAFADIGIEVLYADVFHPAGWMLSLLALGMWFRVLDQTLSPALVVYRKLQYNPLGSAGRIVLIAALLPVGYINFGMAGAVAAIAAGDIPNYIAYMYGLARNRLALIGQDIRMTLLMLGVLGALLGGRYLMGWGWPLDDIDEPLVGVVEDANEEAGS